MLKILIADHYTIFRIGLCQLLLDAFPRIIIEEVPDTGSLLYKAARDKWDIIISGLSINDDDYIKLIRKLKRQSPDISILICGVKTQENYVTRLLKAGASAYIDKAARIATIDWQIKETLSAKMQFR